MRLLATMVVRNEADRYLDSCLKHLRSFVHDVHVFDDDSNDETRDVAIHHGCWVTHRMAGTPSFLEHEGRFRQAAWRNMEFIFQPTEGDWVLALDADEFLVQRQGDLRSTVDVAIRLAEADGAKSVVLPIPEVWGFADDGHPMVRIDGFWPTIDAPRLFRYESGGQFKDTPVACGSEPTYVMDAGKSRDTVGLHLLHYGYAFRADQRAKYERYAGLASGHASSHVESILQQPTMDYWSGRCPEVWRGHTLSWQHDHVREEHQREEVT